MCEPLPTFRLLVVHEAPMLVLMLRRTLESAGRWDLSGARTVATALERLESGEFNGVVLSWALPESGALAFLAALGERSLAERPFVLALHGTWTEDDLARGLQTGVDGFLTAPVTPELLAAEVDGLKKRGETPTRTRLMGLAGARLMRQDEGLWSQGDDPKWRERMTRLAQGLRVKAAQAAQVGGERMVLRLDEVFGEPVGNDAVRVLQAKVDQPLASVESLAEAAGAEPEKAQTCVSVLQELFGTDNPRHPLRSDARMAVAFARRSVSTRPDADGLGPTELDRLRGLAADLLTRRQGDEAMDDAARAELRRRVAHLLRAPAEAVDGLSQDAQAYIAAGLMGADARAESVDRTRLCLLQAALAAAGDGQSMDAQGARALAAALGVGPAADKGASGRLLEMAGGLFTEPAAESLDAQGVACLEGAVNQAATTVLASERVDFSAIRARLAEMRTSLNPGAAVDLGRVNKLVDSWDTKSIVRVGMPLVGAIVRTLDRGRSDTTTQRFCTAAGTVPGPQAGPDGGGGRERLLSASVTLRALRPVPLLDTLRLLAVYQRVLAEVESPSDARIAEIIREEDARQRAERAARGQPGEVPPTPMEKVQVEAQVFALARSLGESDTTLGLAAERVEVLAAPARAPLPPSFPGVSEETMLRLRVLAAVLSRPGNPAEAVVKRILDEVGQDTRALQAFANMLTGPDQRTALEHVRLSVGLADKTSKARDVDGHLANGRLEASVLAIGDLADHDPRLLTLLNEAALALRAVGRGVEGEPLFLRALGLAPHRLNLHFNFARMLFEADRLVECIAAAERCCELAPDFAMAYALLNDARGRLQADLRPAADVVQAA